MSKDKDSPIIKVLPDALADQIAAGEVVERPSSVVRELIENSIDAGATKIIVEVEVGGKDLIRVIDNGIGMCGEDAVLAFTRHATSKVRQFPDLSNISTRGFRGEALPSIASVAKVRMHTSKDENQGGKLVVIEGGFQKEVREISFARGTTVEVRDLFYNTPARRKFLKVERSEFGSISTVVTQQALSCPHIHFTLSHNGRSSINVLPGEQLLYRIAQICGAELVKELIQVEAKSEFYELNGFISSPVFTRSTRSSQYFYVNNRLVSDRSIQTSIGHGYSNLLPKDRFPAFFLHFNVQPHLVDVNVHPAKAEVRFAFQSEVFEFVKRAIREGLSQSDKATFPSETMGGITKSTPTNPVEFNPQTPQSSSYAKTPSFGRASDNKKYAHHDDVSHALNLMWGSGRSSGSPGEQESWKDIPIFEGKPTPVSETLYSEFNLLGQLNNSFIVMQGLKGLLVIDQHVAHERILYERFREAAKTRKIAIQNLLIPKPIEFSVHEAPIVEASLEMFAELGLELESFGEQGFILRSAPAILKDKDHEDILREIVTFALEGGEAHALQDRYEDIVIMMSCRNAIKVNHPLTETEVQTLISDLEATEMPYTCPHGRPISLLFEMDDILKRFLRK